MTAPKPKPFTVVGLDLDHDECIIHHVYAVNGRGATRLFLTGHAVVRRALCVFDGHVDGMNLDRQSKPTKAKR